MPEARPSSYVAGVDGGDWVAAGVSLLVGLVGAFGGYTGAVRAGARSNQAAWAANAVTVAQALLASDDPGQRAAGRALLLAAVRALGQSVDAPQLIRAATRTQEMERVLDMTRRVGTSSECQGFAYRDEVDGV